MALYVLNANAKYCKRTYVSTVTCEPTPSWNAATITEEFIPCSICDPEVEDQDWTVTQDGLGNCSATKIECIGPCDPECCPAYAGPDVFPDIPVPDYCCDTEDEQCLYKWDAEYLCNPSEGDPRWEVTGPTKTCVLPSDVTDKTAFDSSWAFEDGGGIRALDPLRDCTAVWYQLEATLCDVVGDCPDLTEPELDENGAPVLDENNQPITGALMPAPPAGDPSLVCCDGPWYCRRQWSCVYNESSGSWGSVTLVDFACANDCANEPYGEGNAAETWYSPDSDCTYYYWSCDVVECDPHSPDSQCSPGTAPGIPGFTPPTCECDDTFVSYSCAGSGDDCADKTQQPTFNSYNCVGSGDDCADKTQKATFDAYTCTGSGASCGSYWPATQAAYDSHPASGSGIGTFTFNTTRDTNAEPLEIQFALLSCVPKQINVVIRWKGSAGSSTVYTTYFNNLLSTSTHFSGTNFTTKLTSTGGNYHIIDAVASWTSGAPTVSYSIKGSVS